MTDDKNEFDQISVNSTRELERRLGVRQDFILGLLKEDDWSFIVKLHAFIESAVSHLISECTGLQNCGEIFARLPLNDKDAGKIAFVKALDLLPPQQHDFIRRLSELRNALVHNAKNIDFDIKAFIQAQSKEKKSNFVKAFFFGHHSYLQPIPRNPSENDLLAHNPRVMLWANGTLLAWVIAEQTRLHGERRKIDEDKLRVFEEIVANISKQEQKEPSV